MEARKLNSNPNHRIEINRSATRVGTFEDFVLAHAALPMLIMQVLVSRFHFLPNKNAKLGFAITAQKSRASNLIVKWTIQIARNLLD